MLLREKMNLAVPGEFSGRACISALREFWRRGFLGIRAQLPPNKPSFAGTFNEKASSPELHGLLATLTTVRQRILANSVLRGWTRWFVWLLIGMIAVAAVSAKLAGALFVIAILAIFGAAAILAWTWRNRPSHYEAACLLDSAAGLQDRTSTAVYFGCLADPDGMVGKQRKDALVRFAKLDARGFFPVQFPGNVKRASVLVLLVAGLFAYRIHHQPPLVSLLQSTARSQLVQSIFSPIVHAMEKDLQRTMALVTMKPDATGEETQRGDTALSGDDLWKANDEKGPDAQDQKNSADAGGNDQPQDKLQAPGNQEGTPSGDPRQQDSNSQSQQGKGGSESAEGKSQQQSEQQAPEGRQSLEQSLMQALKNMMSNSPNQQSSNRANQQPPNGQGTPQSGNSHQPGATESDKRGESRGNSDAKQKATQTASEGAGSQQGSKELSKDQEMHPVNAVPDRVALEASGFKEQTRMKIATETGTAQLALRDVSPQQDAVTNGAEQENIPARYRFYVQRYFEHADNGKH